MLLHGICSIDEQEGVRRLHWMTAPTKTLVSELFELAKRIFPLRWLAPVGNNPAGDDRMSLHMHQLMEENYGEDLQEISKMRN